VEAQVLTVIMEEGRVLEMQRHPKQNKTVVLEPGIAAETY
jgi:hypothetical protein